MTEHRNPAIEIDVGNPIFAATFSANGEYLVSTDDRGVQLWRVEDGARATAMKAKAVRCIAVSRDGRWVAARTDWGRLSVWNVETQERVFSHEDYFDVNGVDFSPDSTRLAVASQNWSALVWEIATYKRVQTLRHRAQVIAAKYAPRGDRIATATYNGSVRVYDSADGSLLVDIQARVTPWYNTGILWLNNQLFVISDNKIKQFDASSGSLVSLCPVPNGTSSSCLALPKYGEFIAYSSKRTVSLWNTSTHVQLTAIHHPQDISSIALSPDDRFLAVCGEQGKIIINKLSSIIEPDIQIDDAVLESWKHGQLENAEKLLTAAISESPSSHHALSNRALVRARLGQWDAAIIDATESIKLQPSVIAYVAKSIALVGGREKHKAYRVCDIAFGHLRSTHVSFLLLIKAIIIFMAGEHDDAIFRVDDLIDEVPLVSMCYVVQAHMYLLLGQLRMEVGDHTSAAELFEKARSRMRPHASRSLLMISLISGWNFDDLDLAIQRDLCEALYAANRVKEAGECLLNTIHTINEEVYTTRSATNWIPDLLRRCLSTPETQNETDLDSSFYLPLLREWANLELKSGSPSEALLAAHTFTVPRPTVYRVVCDHLEMADRINDAIECFHQMNSELMDGGANADGELANWAECFRRRCTERLERLGDLAAEVRRNDEAITQYSIALSLDPPTPRDIFMKRSKVYMAKALWGHAIDDTNQVIRLDPSYPWGYETKHAALHGAGQYDDAVETFKAMLSKILQSPDPEIRELYRKYVDPGQTMVAIRIAIDKAIRDSPQMLINTDSGRLLDKSGQASLFESQTVYQELISSMITHIDHARIEHEVARYYKYATFSHKWEDGEPLFENVLRVVVYDLEESLTHDKLQMFCRVARDLGLHWAWSDTCCINKADHFVLQEALVSMFKWYESSAVTIVLLRGVRSPAKRGDLVKTIWNTRAWTLQEYHASKVVRFYTEDWKPYLNPDIPNHKESPDLIAEMEEATGVSSRALMALRPGSDDIREKLCLASTRQTTRVEDAAYSLLGIFSMSLPIVYGEGDKALGRFLAQLLTSSGDTSILAWTGRSGSFNSCLPSSITVFGQQPSMHIPTALERTEMGRITARLRGASLGSTSIMELYDRLQELPVPFFVGQRMKLPCITFKLGPLSVSRNKSGQVFRAQTASLGIVEITTDEDLSRYGSLYLVHPWIDFLLDRQPVGSVVETDDNGDNGSSTGELGSLPSHLNIPATRPRRRTTTRFPRLLSFGPHPRTDTASLQPPSTLAQGEKQTRAVRAMARLRQPFGALLLTPHVSKVAAYRRVAAESLITVRVEEMTPAVLSKLVDSIRTLDVL